MSTDAPLIEAPRKNRLPLIIGGVLALALVAGLIYALVGKDDDKGTTTVTIGVIGGSEPSWEPFKQAAADEGIEVELVPFTEYTQPNPALTNADVDLNQFQHIVYLADYTVSTKQDLVPIGSTAIYPLPLYSTKYDAVEDIPDGATVAVPNDPSNRARGLLVLQSAGLITLKSGGTTLSDLSDVDEAKSRVEVTELDASLTVTSLDDVAGAIINNDFAKDAGLDPDDVIAQDDPEDPNALPYVNIFASRPEDADNPTYLKLVKIYQDTKAVTDGVVEDSGDTAVIVRTPADELKPSLARVESEVRATER